MRLIDADLLKKNIAKWLQGGDPQETEMVKLDDIAVSVVMEIEEHPTAYDVEKVVEQLEDLEEDFCQCFRKCEEQCFIQRVTDIVRKGGVE